MLQALASSDKYMNQHLQEHKISIKRQIYGSTSTRTQNCPENRTDIIKRMRSFFFTFDDFP